MDVDQVIVVDDLALCGPLRELEGKVPMFHGNSSTQQQRDGAGAGVLDRDHGADRAPEPVGVVPRLDAAPHRNVVTTDLDIPAIRA